MADQYYANFAQSRMMKNKVFINPNYNRKATENVSNLNTMYVNPHFCNTTSTSQYSMQNDYDSTRSKIYVNPNFIRDSGYSLNNQSLANYYTKPATHASHSTFQCNPYSNPPINKTPVTIPDKQVPTNISKSRYCLVNKQQNKSEPATKVQTNTIRVNKYKLVPLTDVKSKLYTEKKFIDSTITSNIKPPVNSYKSRVKPVTQNVSSSRFKLVKTNAVSLNSSVSKLKLRRTSLLNKSLKKTFTPQKKVVKGVLKKNNIPCPLFKKYGKCLRKIRGNCEYLHDKKHVSICRNFLKGICHNEQCLLSHDLTDKKMPTCYFYLKGACTKENCPYLHVKLNEKASVCLDFLKGYCEKGDKCLNRHINIESNTEAIKGSNSKKVIRKKSTLVIKTKIKTKVRKEVQSMEHEESELSSVSEQRYFKDAIVTEADKFELIRPTRCKLGSLPSFIQL